LETGESADSVVGPEQPATLQQPSTPVVPSKTVRVAERPQKSQSRRGTPREAAVPPLPRTPPPAQADKGDGDPAGTVRSEDRAPALASERSAALSESPPPAVPSKPRRAPERFKQRVAQKEPPATPPARDGAAPQDNTQRAVAASHGGSADTLWPE